LEEIIFKCGYNHPLPQNLPKSLTKIKFGTCYKKEMPTNLPKSLKLVEFNCERLKYCEPFINFEYASCRPQIFLNRKHSAECHSLKHIESLMPNFKKIEKQKRKNMKASIVVTICESLKICFEFLNNKNCH